MRGATFLQRHLVVRECGFNPRAREGRDFFCDRGARLDRRFNPRAREGRDDLLGNVLALSEVSIRAPVRGATTF